MDRNGVEALLYTQLQSLSLFLLAFPPLFFFFVGSLTPIQAGLLCTGYTILPVFDWDRE